MDRFGPTGKVSKNRVHLLRWTTFPGRTGWNFGWMDRALCIADNTELRSDTTRTAPRAISLENHVKTVRYEGLTLQVIGPEKRVGPILGNPGAVSRAGLKGATKVFKHGWKSPWVPTLTGPLPNGQENAGSWLGTKNALYYCAQSTNSFSWVLFVSSYTTAIISPQLSGSFTKLS